MKSLRLRVLSDPEIDAVYAATLACLERTGVDVRNEEGRELLRRAGAAVDGSRVRVPARLIEETLACVPRRLAIYGRAGRPDMHLDPGVIHFGPGPSCTYFVDPWTGERRLPIASDAGLVARVCDALPHIDYVMGLGTPSDVPPEIAPVFEFATMAMNTGKPLMAWAYTRDNMEDIHRVATAIAGGEDELRRRPFFALFACSQPPLIHPDEVLGNALWAVERGLPVVYQGGGSPGASAPITGAGTLVVSLAAQLSGVAILQLKRPGAAVCVGGVPAAADPRTARPCYGGPEMALYSAAMGQVIERLGLAFMGTAGASEAKTVDLQAAIEAAGQVIFSQLGGATMHHDAGMLDCGDIGSLEMLVMTDEIIGMARAMARGLEVSDETLMLDVIDELGPGAEFLSHPSTAKRCRSEVWLPKLMDRSPYEEWAGKGSVEMGERIRAHVRQILEKQLPPALPRSTEQEIDAALADARRRYEPVASL